MNLIDIIELLFLASILVTCILFILFGQVTVRKLRKNPGTKDHLGVQFAHGLDIINVAKALSLPKWFHKKLENAPLHFLYADSDLLYKHTTKFDRILARVFYLFLWVTGGGGIALALLDNFGILE